MERTCQRRGCTARLPLPTGSGRPRLYCSTRCRVAAHRAAPQLPAELTSRERWVRRDAGKRPVRVDNGRPAASTWRTSWTNYQAAVRSEYGVGLGYVLTAEDGVVCIDLDHCLDGGELAPWAAELLEACPPTFVEISPSGTGLHIWGRGRLDHGRVIRDGRRKVEAYGDGRYIAVTGHRWKGATNTLADLTAVLAAV